MVVIPHAETGSPTNPAGDDAAGHPGLLGCTGQGGEAAPLYSQDARPRGPPEGVVVHLLQVCIFL